MHSKIALLLGSLLLASAGAVLAEVDVDAAQALMKKSNCGKCHALDKKKDGPSYKETAKKYQGKPDAEQELYIHLTTHSKVEGKEEEHAPLKTKKEADVRNVVRWILTR